MIAAYDRDEPWHLELDGDDFVINMTPTLPTFGLALPLIHRTGCHSFRTPGVFDEMEHFDQLEVRAREARERVLRSGGRAEVGFCGQCIARPGG
jgi:hypothetical protein